MVGFSLDGGFGGLASEAAEDSEEVLEEEEDFPSDMDPRVEEGLEEEDLPSEMDPKLEGNLDEEPLPSAKEDSIDLAVLLSSRLGGFVGLLGSLVGGFVVVFDSSSLGFFSSSSAFLDEELVDEEGSEEVLDRGGLAGDLVRMARYEEKELYGAIGSFSFFPRSFDVSRRSLKLPKSSVKDLVLPYIRWRSVGGNGLVVIRLKVDFSVSL